jgi:hypothetical protein
MSAAGADLHGFAYGENLEGLAGRSLGYRLLAPAQPTAWSVEVEALARHLQAAPYPDHWPPTDLFCSVLLSGGQRLIAVARYGLADHTPGHRRGGLELIGVVGPTALDVRSALAVYQWLRKRRAEADDLHALGDAFALADVVTAVPPLPAPADPTPVLPVRLWQEGALLFAATTPSDPDHRLNLLEQGAGAGWQWLPLVGGDFPVQTFAQRGPLVAWTPHLAGVALKLDSKPAVPPLRMARRSRLVIDALAVGLLLLLVGLTVINLGTTWALSRQLAAAGRADRDGVTPPETPRARSAPIPTTGSDESRERFARALYNLLVERGGRREWSENQAPLVAQYERLVMDHKDLRLDDADTEGKVAVGAVNVLSQRSADRVEELVRKALADKGFHPDLVKKACEFVHDQLAAEDKDRR